MTTPSDPAGDHPGGEPQPDGPADSGAKDQADAQPRPPQSYLEPSGSGTSGKLVVLGFVLVAVIAVALGITFLVRNAPIGKAGDCVAAVTMVPPGGIDSQGINKGDTDLRVLNKDQQIALFQLVDCGARDVFGKISEIGTDTFTCASGDQIGVTFAADIDMTKWASDHAQDRTLPPYTIVCVTP